MELTLGSAAVVIVLIFFFRSAIRKIVGTTNKVVEQANDVVINNILESRVDITVRTQEAMKKLSELGPIDFEEAYLEAMRKKKNNRK